MKIEINLGHWPNLLLKNWFKLTLAGLGFYLFFVKQMSFQIQVHTPEKTEQRFAKRKPTEKITENATTASLGDEQLERLEIPLLSNGPSGKKGRNGLAELNTINEDTKRSFLKRFAEVAQGEQEKYGIPASLILAASMYQSTAGTRDLAVQANNFFGLPCSSDWRSACVSLHGKSHRKYGSPWASFRDFSQYLDANYANLRGGNLTNYLNALQNDAFGGNANIGEHLLELIETYGLRKID